MAVNFSRNPKLKSPYSKVLLPRALFQQIFKKILFVLCEKLTIASLLINESALNVLNFMNVSNTYKGIIVKVNSAGLHVRQMYFHQTVS